MRATDEISFLRDQVLRLEAENAALRAELAASQAREARLQSELAHACHARDHERTCLLEAGRECEAAWAREARLREASQQADRILHSFLWFYIEDRRQEGRAEAEIDALPHVREARAALGALLRALADAPPAGEEQEGGRAGGGFAP